MNTKCVMNCILRASKRSYREKVASICRLRSSHSSTHILTLSTDKPLYAITSDKAILPLRIPPEGGGEGVLLEILGGGVPPSTPNPGPLSNQKMSFFSLTLKTIPVFKPGL